MSLTVGFINLEMLSTAIATVDKGVHIPITDILSELLRDEAKS
jgi:hypothetical protein